MAFVTATYSFIGNHYKNFVERVLTSGISVIDLENLFYSNANDKKEFTHLVKLTILQ